MRMHTQLLNTGKHPNFLFYSSQCMCIVCLFVLGVCFCVVYAFVYVSGFVFFPSSSEKCKENALNSTGGHGSMALHGKSDV